MKLQFIGGLLVALVAIASPQKIQAGEKTNPPLDKDFLIKVATCNNAEIQIGKLANQHSASSQVKDFATMIVADHKAAGNRLAELLKGHKLAIVAGFDKETKDEVSRLSNLQGKEFDRAFLHCMAKAHKRAITTFENQVKNGREDDIRAYAKEVLPDLRKHLTKANELAETVEK